MTNTQTTFAKTLERSLLEAITDSIFETSRLNACNAVFRTAETAEALLAVLMGERLLRGAR